MSEDNEERQGNSELGNFQEKVDPKRIIEIEWQKQEQRRREEEQDRNTKKK